MESASFGAAADLLALAAGWATAAADRARPLRPRILTRSDDQIVGAKIIELATTVERDSEKRCEYPINGIGPPLSAGIGRRARARATISPAPTRLGKTLWLAPSFRDGCLWPLYELSVSVFRSISDSAVRSHLGRRFAQCRYA